MPALKQASYRNANQTADLPHEAENHRPPPQPKRIEPPPWQEAWRWAFSVACLLWAPSELVRQVGSGHKLDLRLPL
jgi:hypothetical protein